MKIPIKCKVFFLFFSLVFVFCNLSIPALSHELNTHEHQIVENEVVIDTKYNLMWERKTEGNKNDLFTWEEAISYAEELNSEKFSGFSDWRVPSAMESSTLVDIGLGSYEPTINMDAFPNNGKYHYWTASEYPPIPSVVQYTSFIAGNQFKWPKVGLMRVRCVRGGGWTGLYPGNTDNFIVTDETVIDHDTGLEWEQKAWFGEDKLDRGSVDHMINRLSALIPDIPLWLEPLLIDEYGSTGFLVEQGNTLGSGFYNLVEDIPYLLATFTRGVIKELFKMKFTGHPFIGKRSFLMVFSQDEAYEYIDWLNSINNEEGFAGHSDWRLPTVEEIITITDWERIPCIKHEFSPSFTWLYRTATPDPFNERHYFT